MTQLISTKTSKLSTQVLQTGTGSGLQPSNPSGGRQPLSQAKYNEAKNASIDDWLFQPIEPIDFCIKWLPRKYELSWGDRRARESACCMLSLLTGHATTTWNIYLTYPKKIPNLVKKYLRLIDIIWELKRLLILPLHSLYQATIG